MRLGNYKGLRVHRPDVTVQEKEIDNILKREQRQYAVVRHIDEGESIRKCPEFQPIDDEFARDFSAFDSLDEWRAAIREVLEDRRRTSSEEKMCRELLSLVIEDSDIPTDDDLVRGIASALYEELLDDLEERSVPLDKYLKRAGMTEQTLFASKEEEALFAVRSEAVLQAVADRENITISPQELADEIVSMAEDEEMSPGELADELDEEDFEAICADMRMDKAMDFIIENAKYMD